MAELINNYDEQFLSIKNHTVQWKFWSKIISRFKKNGKLLDVGCSKGFFLSQMEKNRNFECSGIENYAPSVEYASKLCNFSKIYLGNANKLDFENFSFDVVTVFDVLEHILNPFVTISECYRVLKPGGLFLITVPNTDSVLKRFKGNKWFAYLDKTHVSLFSPLEWKKKLSDAGFSIVKESSTGFFDIPYFSFVPVFLQKIFLIPGYIQFLSRRFILPPIGETLILVCRK